MKFKNAMTLAICNCEWTRIKVSALLCLYGHPVAHNYVITLHNEWWHDDQHIALNGQTQIVNGLKYGEGRERDISFCSKTLKWTLMFTTVF